MVLLINTPVVEENSFHKFIFALQDIHNYCELKFDVTIAIYFNEKLRKKLSNHSILEKLNRLKSLITFYVTFI